MGWYTATKQFSRRVGDAVIKHKRGDRVFIDFREEAERLKRDKAIIPGQVMMEPLEDEEAVPQADEEVKGIIAELAKQAGLTYEACNAKVKRYTQPDPETRISMPLEEAVMRIKNELSLLSDAEKIELFALDFDLDEDKANEAIAIVKENHECSLDEAIEKIRSECAHPEDPEEADGGEQESEDGLHEGVAVLVEYKGELRTGTVVKVCEGDEVRVKLDDDDADYRRLNREDIDLVTDAWQE